jgi:hypothetical protein
MEQDRDTAPCNTCEGYNKFVDRNVYINSSIPDFKPLTQAVKNWEYEDMFEASREDVVNKPKHYTTGKYEVIDVIEDWNLNFRLANAVKYIARHKHKGKPLEDLKKALWYLQREIDKHGATK